jgi:hypothetical protein
MIIFPLTLFADQLILKDGTTYYGRFLSGDYRNVTFQDDSGQQHTFDTQQIQTLDFNGEHQGSANRYNNENYGPPSNGYSQPTVNGYEPPPANNGYTTMVLPAGAQIAVRTNESIESNAYTPGQTYDATIAQDVLDPNGNVLIPQGSDAQLVIRDLSRGGIAGSPKLVLDLQSIQVNGQNYLVNTSDVVRSGKTGIGANKRTAEMVGGGAALGTLLGAVAGGGTGAAIGALAGAAAGGAAEVLTRGDHVRVPAESVLTFRLDSPLNLQPAPQQGY